MNSTLRFSLMVTLALLVCAGSTVAEVIYAFPGESRIGLAMESAAPGDSVLAFPGEYLDSNVTIPAGVHLIGYCPYPGDIVINAEQHGRVLTIEGGDTQIVNVQLLGGWAIRGGGAHVDAGSILFEDVTFTGNQASTGAGLFVGGGEVELRNCVFVDNTAATSGGALQAMQAGSLLLDHCLIHGNVAEVMGGAWQVSMSSFILQNCTVDGNQAPAAAEGVCFGTEAVVIDHGIATDNRAASGPATAATTFLNDHASRPQHSCSLRWQQDGDAWPGFLGDQLADVGLANLDADPGYCQDDATEDIWAHLFGLDGDSPALPQDGGCGLRGAYGQMCEPTGTPDLPRLATKLHNAFPNPFNPSTKIMYDVAQRGPVSLKIYSLDGRCVATLVNEEADTGRHEAVWMGRDQAGRSVASGVYLARLVAADSHHAIRLTLVK